MARFNETVLLNGALLKEDIQNMAGDQKLFAEAIGVSRETIRKAINGIEISTFVAKKITKGLFKPDGYYNAAVEKKAEAPASSINLNDILTLLEDIKQEQTDTVKAVKTMTTLMARLLALWEGEKHDNAKGSDS